MSSKHQLAPNAKCLVCNDDASGFHYGVNSCEGCKGFFRRCITQGINFRCSNEEKCQITPFTRNSCQYCRLKKCFQVGMSREASRLGRRPKKILKGTKTVSGDTGGVVSQSSGGSSPEVYDYPTLARATLTDMFGLPPEMMQHMSKNMPIMMHKMQNGMMAGDVAELARMGINIPPGAMHMPPGMAMPPGMNMPQEMPMNMTQGTTHRVNNSAGNSDSIPGSGAAEQVSAMDLNKWREKQFEVMSRYMHTKDSSNPPDAVGPDLQMRQECSASESASSDKPISSPPSVGSSSSVNTFGLPDNRSESINVLTISEAQASKLLKFKEYSIMEKSEETIDIINEVEQGIIGSHFEHCFHQRPRITEAVAALDEREANGESLHPPNGFWSHWMSELLPAIERVVRFLKDVPGFRELPISDQIFSIKKGAFCILLSQAMPMVDSDSLTVIDPTLKYRNTRDDFEMMPPMFAKLFDDHFLLSREFKLSGITDEETGLMNAILGVNSSVDGFENKSAIMKLEQIFVQTLHTYVTTNYPGDPDRFDRIIRLIPLVENTSASHTSSLHSMKTDSPRQTQAFPPLHREIYDLSDN